MRRAPDGHHLCLRSGSTDNLPACPCAAPPLPKVARIEAEEAAEAASRRARQAGAQADIQAFVAQQAELRNRQREAEAEEEM